MKKAEKKILLALRQGLPEGSRLLLAVSGGCDSLALADGCAYWSRRGRFLVRVCHVEHGIRGTAALADATSVEAFCARKGLPFSCRHVSVPDYLNKHPHLSLEGAARKLRYEILAQEAEAEGCDFIVTAHQADDQAETVLLKLLRGGGSAGLSGIAAVRGKVLRPFLKLRRSELEAYCAAKKLEYCHDDSNEDLRFWRNRVRAQLLPYLEEHYNPGVRELLWQTAQLLREDDECLRAQAREQYDILAQWEAEGVSLPITELAALPAAIAKRLLRKAALAAGSGELGYKHSQALLELLKKQGGSRVDLPDRVSAYKKGKRLYFYREEEKKHGYQTASDKIRSQVQPEEDAPCTKM